MAQFDVFLIQLIKNEIFLGLIGALQYKMRL